MRASGQLGLAVPRWVKGMNGKEVDGRQDLSNERLILIKRILGRIMHDGCRTTHEERLAVNKRK